MNPLLNESGSASPSAAAGAASAGLGAAVELAFDDVHVRPGQKAPIFSALPILRAAAAATAGSGRRAPLKLKLGSGLLAGGTRWGDEGGIFSI